MRSKKTAKPEVTIRIRGGQEAEPEWQPCIARQGSNWVELVQKQGHKFCFTKIEDADVTQDVVYDDVGKTAVDTVFEGYSATVIAYGQTGSGKTYTMVGDDAYLEGARAACDARGAAGLRHSFLAQLPDSAGICPRAAQDIFRRIEEGVAQGNLDEEETVVTVTYVEVYGSEVYDLLQKGKRMEVRNLGEKGFVVTEEGSFEPVPQRPVRNAQELIDCLLIGNAPGVRHVRGTDMNERSSRSHCIFSVVLHQKQTIGNSCTASLVLVDLAGSEDPQKSGKFINIL